MTLSSAERYIASRYEFCIDKGMDTDSIRRYLQAHGLPRTPAQIQHDLDVVYGFTGYADTHQPAPALTLKQIDKAIGRSSNTGKLLP